MSGLAGPHEEGLPGRQGAWPGSRGAAGPGPAGDGLSAAGPGKGPGGKGPASEAPGREAPGREAGDDGPGRALPQRLASKDDVSMRTQRGGARAAAPGPGAGEQASQPAAAAVSGPATLGLPAADLPADELDELASDTIRRRRFAIRLLVITFVLIPAVALLATRGLTGTGRFLIPATAAYLVLIDRCVLVRSPAQSRLTLRSWLLVLAALGLAAGLFMVGHMGWLTPLAVASAAVGRYTPTGRQAVLRVAGCGLAGAVIAAWQHLAPANIITATIVPVLGGMLAHNAERRALLISRLRETRAELARMAVAEERLRIARDLHDLLGHSLSLIALKAELAGRVIGTDTGRAAREIAGLETVARRSLTEVRQAVTSYRQPSLAAELAAARRMLASAGIGCRVQVPDAYSLPPDVDALLAWTVREGATNIVRHAGARHVDIEMAITGKQICATLADDGSGPPAARPGGPPRSTGGSGLAGLAERASSLGGALHAGGAGRGGFRLQVCVPLAGPACQPAAPGGAASRQWRQ